MNWRDLLYFSKGERRALTLLLCLIIISWVLLVVTDKQQPTTPQTVHIITDTIRGEIKTPPIPDVAPVTKPQNSSREKSQSLPKENRRRPARHIYPKSEKFPVGTVVELNSADTTILKKVPGIGSTFARRIVSYRELLGGYYSVSQLMEVYGMDEERYESLKGWFMADTIHIQKLSVNQATFRELLRHPYIEMEQTKVIEQLRRQKGRLTGWENLQLLEEFTDADRERLTPYLSFD